MASYTFGQVPSIDAGRAFAFHRRVIASNRYVWPRTEDEIREFAEAGQLFGARRDETAEFVAICYVAANEDESELEVGGLITDESVRGLGVGTFLARLAIAYTIAFERPWDYGQHLTAEVHEANNAPRTLLRRLGFEFVETVSILEHSAPASLRRSAGRDMMYDKFRFTQDGVTRLARWLREFDGTLGRPDVTAGLDLGLATVQELLDALES